MKVGTLNLNNLKEGVLKRSVRVDRINMPDGSYDAASASELLVLSEFKSCSKLSIRQFLNSVRGEGYVRKTNMTNHGNSLSIKH